MFNGILMRLFMSPGEPGPNPGGDPPADPNPPAGDPSRKEDPKGAAAPPSDPDDSRVKEAREEAISERKKRQAAEAALKDLQTRQAERDASLRKALGVEASDDDPEAMAKKAKADRDALEQTAKKALMKSAVSAEAMKQGAISPEDVFALSDISALEVDLEKATVSGVEDLVKKTLEAKPFLKKAAAAAPGGGSPPASDPNPQAAGKDELEKLVEKAKKGDPQAHLMMLKRLKEIKAAGIEV